MATNTWVALDKVTVGSATPSITFSSIPATYTDLVINISGNGTSDQSYQLQFNGNTTGTKYSLTYMFGTGSGSGNTGRQPGQAAMNAMGRQGAGSTFGVSEIHILNYANTAIYKTVLGRGSNADVLTIAAVGTWADSAAISTILITPESGGNINTGSTFSLYGIRAANVSPAPKAIGGSIYTDDLYYYHVFGSTGVFTPSTTLSCDYVIVAGGGGGAGASGAIGGGGGAGGFRSFTSQTLSATNYSVTVGAGGAGGAAGNNNGASGGLSSFNSANTTGGGYGSIQGGTAASGGSGGGGGWAGGSGGAGNAGGYSPVEGYAGGTSGTTGSYDSSSGGGGAGGVGSAPGFHIGGAGGIGATSALVNAIGAATGVAQLVNGNYYLAGGGGGAAGFDVGYGTAGAGGAGGGGIGGTILNAAAAGTLPGNGVIGTGGGGGGAGAGTTARAGGNGGSGSVIIRYLKA